MEEEFFFFLFFSLLEALFISKGFKLSRFVFFQFSYWNETGLGRKRLSLIGYCTEPIRFDERDREIKTRDQENALVSFFGWPWCCVKRYSTWSQLDLVITDSPLDSVITVSNSYTGDERWHCLKWIDNVSYKTLRSCFPVWSNLLSTA